MFYRDHSLLGQVIEAINLPENILDYVCKELEVKRYKPCYATATRLFSGLCETIDY